MADMASRQQAGPTTGSRTAGFQESVIREMTRLGDEAGAVNLSQGLPDFQPPQALVDAAVAALRGGDNQYTFPFGSEAFRRALAVKYAAYNGIHADPATGVTVTVGVSEGIMSTIFALTEPGDEAVILEPWYENYLPACIMAGVTPLFVPLAGADYRLDVEAVRAALTPRTRLILINTPHNPTGRVFSREELIEVAALCVERTLIAVTDEIYERHLYDGREHISIGSLPGMEDRTVTVSGLGKTYAVTGWRVGWAVAHPALSAAIRKVHDYMTVCAPAPFQAAGIAALALPESYYQDMQSAYDHRRDLLLQALDQAGFRFAVPQGAYYVMADFSAIDWPERRYAQPGWTKDRAFAEYMAREVGVAVVPGSSFYQASDAGQTRVRLNFAKKEETLIEAGRRLQRLKR
jgi:aminotransferase